MLKIYFGDMDKAIYNTGIYFKNDYDPEWLNDSVVKEMILDTKKERFFSIKSLL